MQRKSNTRDTIMTEHNTQTRTDDRKAMKTIIDAPGVNTDHGYTTDNKDTVWYWKWDGENLVFREAGTHTDHPIRYGPVPEPIREYTKQFIEQNTNEK